MKRTLSIALVVLTMQAVAQAAVEKFLPIAKAQLTAAPSNDGTFEVWTATAYGEARHSGIIEPKVIVLEEETGQRCVDKACRRMVAYRVEETRQTKCGTERVAKPDLDLLPQTNEEDEETVANVQEVHWFERLGCGATPAKNWQLTIDLGHGEKAVFAGKPQMLRPFPGYNTDGTP